MSCYPRAIALIPLVATLILAAPWPENLVAQDGLFDAPAGNPLFGDEPGSAVANDPASEETADPLSEQLQIKARRGDIQLAESVAALVRVGRWSEANTLLSEAASRKIDDAVLAAMAAKIEPALRLRMVRSEELEEPAREFVEKLSAAATANAQSETRLTAAIDQLDAASVDTRIGAIRTLLSGGNHAIKALVDSVVTASPPAASDDILRTMLRLGDGGIDALRQLALYGKPPERLAALKALVRINPKAATNELVTALLASDSTENEVDFAATQLQNASAGTIDSAAGIDFLARRLQRFRETARTVDNDFQTRILWSVNQDRKSINFREVQAMLAAYRDAADAASRLRRIGTLSRHVANEVLAAELSYRVILDPDWGDEKQLETFSSDFATTLQAASWVGILSNAVDSGDVPAAVGMLRLIGSLPDADQRYDLLLSAAPNPSPLVMAAISAEPRIRYEAATVIAAMGLQRDYPGSSLVLKTLNEMASLESLPMAILVETQAELILAQETILKQLGYSVLIAHSVAGAERAVDASSDLRLIVSKTNLADASPIELIDRVRRHAVGEEVPIVFFGDVVAPVNNDRWSAVVHWKADPPSSPLAYAELLDNIALRNRLPELTQLDRELYRQIGMSALQQRRTNP
ncbi:putative membrane or secreted protein [Rhodopirellula maiorica SM1]|uniref:Putative membrane or secreted protein n=1 Tax=Rhodopirellula maiorica SM1 TaxID=1265738 RepID=M5RPV2_9BACT|nr:hypothetical protein [Rhodopirellula maiorica]EMI21246.1 putative membrane or secreted protein [Rhodopirellula maiorica SM1]